MPTAAGKKSRRKNFGADFFPKRKILPTAVRKADAVGRGARANVTERVGVFEILNFGGNTTFLNKIKCPLVT